MSSKPSSALLKTPCDKFRRNLASSTNKKVKIKLPKKVVISKKWHQNCSHGVKSQSAGVIDDTIKETANPKKVTKSESTVTRADKRIDYCKKCGDTENDITTAVSEYTGPSGTRKSNETDIKNIENRNRKANTTEKHTVQEYYKNENFKGIRTSDSKTKTDKFIANDPVNNRNCNKEKEMIQEFYKNEKFQYLYDSMHEIDNGLRNLGTLDTIAEDNEKQTSDKSAESIYIVDSSDEETNVKELKNFRDKNFFECHSAKTRVKSKDSVTSLREHKCSYRFFLNDRLFPVAVNEDYSDSIRCVDCHLPLELSRKNNKVNGTIQAKVKLDGETKDTLLLLPVREPLIVQQRRKEKKDSEVVYFGLIKLDQNGNSVFKRSLPCDSLALKYQKGYQEFDGEKSYRYEKVDEGNIVYI